MGFLDWLTRRPEPARFSDPEVQAQADRIRAAWAECHAEMERGRAMGLYITMKWDGLGDPDTAMHRFRPALNIVRYEKL